ncbi:MAG TPA: outer membrane beta-barrel protein [Candidatus Eisenbacteria bacterium]
MRATFAFVTLAVLALVVLAGPTHAQSDSTAAPTTKAWQVWMGGGISFPASGTFKDTYDSGWNARGMLSYRSAGMPIGLRLDVGAQEFDFTSSGIDASIRALSVLLDITHDFQLGTIQPYVAVGAGGHSIEPGPETVESVRSRPRAPSREVEDNLEYDPVEPGWRFGLNGVIGLKLPISPRMMIFAEGRIDQVFVEKAILGQDDLQMIPVTFGIVF